MICGRDSQTIPLDLRKNIERIDIDQFDKWLENQPNIRQRLIRVAHFQDRVFNWYFNFADKHHRALGMPYETIRITGIVGGKVLLMYEPEIKERPYITTMDFELAKLTLEEASYNFSVLVPISQRHFHWKKLYVLSHNIFG